MPRYLGCYDGRALTDVTDAAGFDIPADQLFANRELSFVAYNECILDEAKSDDVPLLERVKFLGIVAANLDSFFMVRVAGIRQQLKQGVLAAGPDGMLPADQLDAIRSRVGEQVEAQERVLLDLLLPALAKEKIGIGKVVDLSTSAQVKLRLKYEADIFPMLTPLAVDPGHPFPFLRNRTLNLAVHLVPDDSPHVGPGSLLAVVQVPSSLPRFISVDADDVAFVLIEDLIAHHVGQLFHGMRVQECVPFRVTRNWALSFDADEQEDLLSKVEKKLQRRWRHDAVRMEIGIAASSQLEERLRVALDLDAADVQPHRGPLAVADFLTLGERVGRPDLRDAQFAPVSSPALHDEQDLFDTIADGDVLLHHPYESYEPVLSMLKAASSDPQVLAIKQTIYRVHRDSPLLAYLTRAAHNGKQVTALVELKARFDEETNVHWARTLERAGVQVVYGLMPLKTHCKVTMVVRREADGMRRYVHLGTGNYNEKVATQYSDLSYFTARPEVGDDIADLFNHLTGYSTSPKWRQLVVAPHDLRKHLVRQIERTTETARAGGSARIILKSNSLIDEVTSRALCAAAQAGVEVVLLIRGPSTLRVGIPHVSEGVKVRLIIDRFLEHSRILYFKRDDEEDVFLTSTDIMHRNLDWRVEVMLPVLDPAIKRRIVDEILAIELADNQKASMLGPDGRYVRVSPHGERPRRAQEEFIRLAQERAALADGSEARRDGGESEPADPVAPVDDADRR